LGLISQGQPKTDPVAAASLDRLQEIGSCFTTDYSLKPFDRMAILVVGYLPGHYPKTVTDSFP
jgi:hypothetical protein